MSVLPAPKEDFIDLEGKVHLATGGQPPLLVRHREAFYAFAADKARGMDGYDQHWAVVDETRELLAPHFALAADEIALIGNASEGLSKPFSIEWREGDNAVVCEQDYASGRYAWRGWRVSVSKSDWCRVTAGGSRPAICSSLRRATKAVYVSQVNAMTGQLVDIEPLSTALTDTPTTLLLDASHALGVVPVRADLADFTVSSCYKFVLGIHEGVFAWNRARRPDFLPFGVGWAAASPGAHGDHYLLKPDARRVEFGNAGHLGAYLLCESLQYLESFGIEAIQSHAQTLARRLAAGMTANGSEVMTPDAPGEQAGNAAFVCAETGAFVKKAEADGIYVWGDNNRIRASAHVFTTEADVDFFGKNCRTTCKAATTQLLASPAYSAPGLPLTVVRHMSR